MVLVYNVLAMKFDFKATQEYQAIAESSQLK